RGRPVRPRGDRREHRAMKKRGQVEKYEFWGLVLFVGIPLPVTGAWTGSLVAALLNMDVKKAIVAELLGIWRAAGIMTRISSGIIGS
ncbi:MAG: small multi-drug export protein, partial [Lachnospiraceae bacterium]|nr:small multi-drug export protein [Lachnospiraceae bacterium]